MTNARTPRQPAALGTVPAADGAAGLAQLRGLWDGDLGTLSLESRRAFAALLQGPIIVAQNKPALWAAIVSDEMTLRSRLNDVFLDLVLNEDDGIAFTRPANSGEDLHTPEGQTHPMPIILRSKPLSHVDTLVILHLRQELSLAAPGERVIIDRDDLRDHVMMYRPDGDRDEAKMDRRFTAAFKRMVEYSLLAKTETDNRFEISPALRSIFDADTVEGIKAEYDARFRIATESESATTAEVSAEVDADAIDDEGEPDEH